MTKDEMTTALAAYPGVPSKAAAAATLAALADLLAEQLAAGNTVRLHKVGVFRSRIADAHTARHPRTGEQVDVPKRTHVGFRVSDALRDHVRSEAGAAAA